MSCSQFRSATDADRKTDKIVERAKWMGWGLVSKLRGWGVEAFCFSEEQRVKIEKTDGSRGTVGYRLEF